MAGISFHTYWVNRSWRNTDKTWYSCMGF